MNKGMLWFDNDPKVPLETKIHQAVVYYMKKYQETPSHCFIHPTMYPNPDNQPIILSGVEVRPNRSVLPNHFWIGKAGTTNLSQAAR